MESDLATSHTAGLLAEFARDEAVLGFTDYTASYLNRDTELSDSEKGSILAEAYDNHAELIVDQTEPSKANEMLVADRQRIARRSKRIAQGLTRAAKRVQNT